MVILMSSFKRWCSIKRVTWNDFHRNIFSAVKLSQRVLLEELVDLLVKYCDL